METTTCDTTTFCHPTVLNVWSIALRRVHSSSSAVHEDQHLASFFIFISKNWREKNNDTKKKAAQSKTKCGGKKRNAHLPSRTVPSSNDQWKTSLKGSPSEESALNVVARNGSATNVHEDPVTGAYSLEEMKLNRVSIYEYQCIMHARKWIGRRFSWFSGEVFIDPQKGKGF